MKRRGFLAALIAIPFAPLVAKLDARKAAKLAEKNRILALLEAKLKLHEELMRKQMNHWAYSNSLNYVKSYTENDPIDFGYGQAELHQGHTDDCDLCGCSPAEYEWKQLPGHIEIAV